MYLILAGVCGVVSFGAPRVQCRFDGGQKLEVVRRASLRKLTEETWRFLCEKFIAAVIPASAFMMPLHVHGEGKASVCSGLPAASGIIIILSNLIA